MQALQYLQSLEMHGIKLGLERIKKILKLIGNPEKKLKAVHIAGTNGKGSTAAMVAAVLLEAGHKTALYTSPHLISFNERIQIDGKMISDSELETRVAELKKLKEEKGIELTYFEFVTALAFQYFADKEVDYAVIETGMGGALDATNVCKPAVSIITNVALEHMKYLGKTAGEIAREKAGVIKKGIPLITAESDPEVMLLFKQKCNELNSEMHLFGIDFGFERTSFDLKLQSFNYHGGKNIDALKIPLLGIHQLRNASCAIAALQLLKIDEATIRKGLMNVQWPGRLEIAKEKPLVLLDAGHNSACMKALREALQELLPGREITLVIGISDDKDAAAIAEAIAPIAAKVKVCSAKYRGMETESLAAEFKGTVPEVAIIADVQEAVKMAMSEAAEDDAVIVTGSCFVVGEAKQLFL